jgi:2-polyprenyl-3-methyl-5-hydroxy-6-metoxy-1,4-benzoquinol methylase
MIFGIQMVNNRSPATFYHIRPKCILRSRQTPTRRPSRIIKEQERADQFKKVNGRYTEISQLHYLWKSPDSENYDKKGMAQPKISIPLTTGKVLKWVFFKFIQYYEKII